MGDLDIHIVEQEGGLAVVQLTGSLDASTSQRLAEIAQVLYEKGCRGILLSCESLQYVNSAGLRVLLKIARWHSEGRDRTGLILCSLSRDIKVVLRLAGFLRCILVYDDVPQAREALGERI